MRVKDEIREGKRDGEFASLLINGDINEVERVMA